jgi:hypothetical protein
MDRAIFMYSCDPTLALQHSLSQAVAIVGFAT